MPSITGKSRYSTSVLTVVGRIIAARPITPSELNMFDPSTLPIAMSFSPFSTLATDAAGADSDNSQADYQIANT
jgi:hypothetical protein